MAETILALSPHAHIDLKTLPPRSTFLRVLGVNYVHVKTEADDDLYLTQYGVPYLRHLMPENWYEPTWFKEHRQRLHGTGTVYRVPTKSVAGHMSPTIQLCIKWSRVGQDVPLDTFTLYKNLNAEFNTPFEEFALVEELRRGEYGPRNLRIHTQKPLAIYVPSERLQLWQTGRSREKILARIARRPGIEIDVLRSYILIYGWIDGLDGPDAYGIAYEGLADVERDRKLSALTTMVDEDLHKKGFMVADHKPTHVIVRLNGRHIRTRRQPGSAAGPSRPVYAVVDYELLARTPDHEDAVKSAARSVYLIRQRDRFVPRTPDAFPPHLRPARILGVDYVYGRCESTGGALWVVGNDPELFAYFLPERWRMKQVGLSETGQTYYVQTKDRIHLVWQVCRVGELPPPELLDEKYNHMRLLGYNSPFEKMWLALEMSRRGIKTVYPRAVYMTGQSGASTQHADPRRFEAMRELMTPDGLPVMPSDHDYITLFGYWRGREDAEAVQDSMLWTPIDASAAAAKGIITEGEQRTLLDQHRRNLAAAGFQDLNLKGDHVLLSYVPEGPIKREPDGTPELRHGNFDMVKKVGTGSGENRAGFVLQARD